MGNLSGGIADPALFAKWRDTVIRHYREGTISVQSVVKTCFSLWSYAGRDVIVSRP